MTKLWDTALFLSLISYHNKITQINWQLIPTTWTSNIINSYWIENFETFSVFQGFYSTPVLSDSSSGIRIHYRYIQLLVVVVAVVVFVVGLDVVVSVFVEVDVGDLGVVDVEVVPTLKYNTNNVANWSSNYYPWVVAMKEFNENVQNAREKSSKDKIWKSFILYCFFIFFNFHVWRFFSSFSIYSI